MDKDNIHDIDKRIFILELEVERHASEIKTIIQSNNELQKSFNQLNDNIKQIKNWVIGGVFVIAAQQFGLAEILKSMIVGG